MNIEQLAANAGMTLSNAGYSKNIACSTEALQRFADMVAANERLRVRAALVDEAKIWTGDHRTAAWAALCDGARRADIEITKDDCHLAMRTWLSQVEAEGEAGAEGTAESGLSGPALALESPSVLVVATTVAEQPNAAIFVSFRAECSADVDRIVAQLGADHPGCWGITQNVGFDDLDMQHPDRRIELMIRPPLTVDGLRTCISKVADGHVMGETLRAVRLQDNSLQRRDEADGDGSALRAVDRA